MKTSMLRSIVAASIAVALAGTAGAQPPPMTAKGCCCAVVDKAYKCAEKTQADCLAEQPGAPMYPRMEDWKKAYEAGVKASEAQEGLGGPAKPMRGGWISGPCEK